MKKTLMAGVMTLWAASAWAHSPLEATAPAHQATLAGVPNEIVMRFDGNIRLTRVTLTHAAQEADLDLTGFDGFVSNYTIPMPSMGAGAYFIEWRGLGDDGHPMKGSFSFTVKE